MSSNKHWFTEGSKEWAEYMLKWRGDDYAKKYTKDIFLRNAFSSSVLAYSIDKQIKSKMGEKEVITNEASILIGEAVHNHLQSLLSKTYIINNEFKVRIPYEWNSIPEKEIIVICHPDAYSLEQRNILEYKTSFGEKAHGTITESMKRQACFYWKLIKDQIGIDCDIRVVKIWEERIILPDEQEAKMLRITEWTAKPDEKISYANEMNQRALDCAKILDEEYGKHGFPPLPNTGQGT